MYISEPPPLKKRLTPNRAYDELRPKMKVVLKILEHSDIRGEDAYFSELVKEMKNIVSRKTIHQALDGLIDQGTIRSAWTKNAQDRWIRGYKPASEGQRRLLRRTYYATHDDIER